MSLPELPRNVLKRLSKIKAGLLKGDNYETIGKACGVTERTIDRDVKAWMESGDFEVWIKTMWIELHGKITNEDPTEAYKQVSKLMARMMTQKQEIHAQGTISVSGIDENIQKIIEFSRTEPVDNAG